MPNNILSQIDDDAAAARAAAPTESVTEDTPSFPTRAEVVAAIELLEVYIRSEPLALNAPQSLGHLNGVAVAVSRIDPKMQGLSAGTFREDNYMEDVDGERVEVKVTERRRARNAEIASE